MKNSLQNFHAEEMQCSLRMIKSRSESVEKNCFVFIILKFQDDAVFKMCQLLFYFQNRLAKYVPFSCEREAYLSHFSPFLKCAGIM